MANGQSKNNGLGRWIIIALIVAAFAVGVIYYIGWFDQRTHVDTPAGDNVEATYEVADPESPAQNAWENTSGQSLDEIITEPAVETAAAPSAE